MRYANQKRLAGAIRRLGTAERRANWANELETKREIEYGRSLGTRSLR